MLSLEGIRDARPEPTTTTDGGSQPPPVTLGGTEVGETVGGIPGVSTSCGEPATDVTGDKTKSDAGSEGGDAMPSGEPGGGLADGCYGVSPETP